MTNNSEIYKTLVLAYPPAVILVTFGVLMWVGRCLEYSELPTWVSNLCWFVTVIVVLAITVWSFTDEGFRWFSGI